MKKLIIYLKHFKRHIISLMFKIEGKLCNVRVGKKSTKGKFVRLCRKNLSIGNNVYIGQYTYLSPNLSIGNFCLISDQVQFIGSDHVFDIPGKPIILSGRPTKEPFTIIEDDVWIGHASTIMRGITIGEGSIVAANSVVTKDVKPYSIVAGVPAKFIRPRFTNDKDIEKHMNSLKELRNSNE